MSVLYKKALRDMISRLGSYLACAMVMAIGLMMYSAMTHAVNSIPTAQYSFYEKYDFADVFSSLHSMPVSAVSRIEGIEGVSRVSGRLTTSVRCIEWDNVELKLISYDPNEADRLNDIEIIEGSAPAAGKKELVLNKAFYEAHELSPGDSIPVSVNGRRYDFTVSGSVWMPEYIYVVPEGSLFADNSRYGIAYAPLDTVEGMLNLHNERNDVSILLEDGVEFGTVERNLKDAMNPYGLYRLTQRDDQVSHLMVEQEIEGMKAMVKVVPIMFLFIGALIMSVIVKRTIEQQRTQIGLLKAFGYPLSKILFHYALYGVMIGALASVLGGFLGSFISNYFAQLFSEYFYMPGISGEFELSSVVGLSVLAEFFSVSACIYGAREVLKLSPASAMHPPAPKKGKPIMLERIGLLWSHLSSCSRMAMRNLFRSKSRSVTTLIGLTICYGLTTAVFAMSPMIDYMMIENFFDVQRYDIKISLNDLTLSQSLKDSLMRERGVETVEQSLELPATVRAGSRSKDINIMAIENSSTLYLLFDKKTEPVKIPSEGAVITYRMAQSLGVGVGDRILLDIAYPDREVYVEVAALSEQYSSNYLIIDHKYLSGLMHMSPLANAAMIKLDDMSYIDVLTSRLEDAEFVSTIYNVSDMQSFIMDTMKSSMQTLYGMALMSIFAGFAIVYNSSIVSLSERTRELASMRVMGFTLFETVRVISLEQLVLLVIGMALGAPLAYMMTYALSASMSTDMYSMPYGVPLITYLQVIACFIGSWGLALIILARKITKTEMSDVLKTRE